MTLVCNLPLSRLVAIALAALTMVKAGDHGYGYVRSTRVSNLFVLRMKNPTTGGDTLSPHFWFQVFYYFL